MKRPNHDLNCEISGVSPCSLCPSSVNSVLSVFLRAHNYRAEKAVGGTLGRKRPEKSIRAYDAFHAHGFLQKTIDRASCADNTERILKRAEHFADDAFIFLGLERTRGIYQSPVRRQMRQSVAQKQCLARVQILEIFRPKPPPDLGMPGEGARSRA